ncbi:periphilin-1 [Hyperolius riggenbachi]|uniref:periphilin-1 n=1 Tax=Hyperolius riggenbachi TaxID=752182 RepID=UPI0035A2DD68
MYHRGGDPGWHRGHHERDVQPPRNHDSRMYRGGYHNAREHDGYGQYYDHNPREDRNYDEHYEASSYHEEHSPYHEYREQGYHRGGHHDSGYQDYRGGYWQGRGKIGKYNKPIEPQPKQYPYKHPKSFRKETDVKIKDSSPKPVHTVIHNPGRSIVTVCGSPEHRNETKSIPLKDKSLERNVANRTQDSAKHTMHDSTKPEEDNKQLKQDDTRPVENSEIPSKDKVNYDPESAQPSEEDTEGLEESEQLLGGMKTSGEEAKIATKEVKTEQEEVKIDFIKDRVHSICAPDQDTTERKKAQPSGNRMAIADIKQEEETSSAFVTGKRIQMENEDFCIKTEPEDTFFEKRARKSHDDHFYSNKPVEIPLLDGWTDMPSEAETAGSSTQVQTDTAENSATPDTAQQLRKAFILARKDEIELAFSRDCRTFAFVASTLLKKDPSMEAAVTNALRSCLQDVASHCVQELTSFIDHYDHVLNPNTNRRPKSDP